MQIHPPVTPNASQEACELLSFLYSISGKHVLAGQHNFPASINRFSALAEEISGKAPALWGQDFGFAESGIDDIHSRPAMIREAIRQHNLGSIVTLMWHAVNPAETEPAEWVEILNSRLIDEQWQELLDEGSELNARWASQVDVVADYLKQLRDAGVPVLWRPYHEMNGDWFWWGNRPGSGGFEGLWRMLYRRLTTVHKLNNLIWVFNANAPRFNAGPYAPFYPGHDVVDVLASDVYGNDYLLSHHDELLELAGGRPIAIGECGQNPSPTLFETQPQWCWFMTWTTFLTSGNSPDEVRELYHCPVVLGREQAKALRAARNA